MLMLMRSRCLKTPEDRIPKRRLLLPMLMLMLMRSRCLKTPEDRIPVKKCVRKYRVYIYIHTYTIMVPLSACFKMEPSSMCVNH